MNSRFQSAFHSLYMPFLKVFLRYNSFFEENNARVGSISRQENRGVFERSHYFIFIQFTETKCIRAEDNAYSFNLSTYNFGVAKTHEWIGRANRNV